MRTGFATGYPVSCEHVERELGRQRNAIRYRELIDMKWLQRISGNPLDFFIIAMLILRS